MNKNLKISQEGKGQVVLYKSKVEVRLENETVWLAQAQIAALFGTQRPAITKHLDNIFKTKELHEKSVCSILGHTAPWATGSIPVLGTDFMEPVPVRTGTEC